MRRALVLSILAMLLVIGGVAPLIASAAGVRGPTPLNPWTHACAAFFAAAAGAALAAIASLLIDHRQLRRLLTAQLASGKLSSLPGVGKRGGLKAAINQTLSHSNRAVVDAQFRQKELEIQLRVATAQRLQAEAILFSISDAVLVTDGFDQLVLANDAAARTFGFDLASATRKKVADLLVDKGLAKLIGEVRASGNSAGRRIVEHQMRSGQSELTFKATFSSVIDSAGELAGIVTVLHDMTKEREVAQMKNEFVSNVSHELRTPLASIRAYIEMLIDGEADDEKTTRDFYEVIQNEANRLGRLIDNILNISRIESGLVKINQEPQSLTVITKEAIEVIAPQARLKQITIDEQLTPIFYQTPADRDMLYQAVLNLLSNAVKYTPEKGRITVQTSVDEARRCVIAKITDTGVGIPPKDLPFVFDKFFRAEANNKMAKGTGLGLSLVKHIIETVHKGRIFVDSVVGKGSTFGFELSLSE